MLRCLRLVYDPFVGTTQLHLAGSAHWPNFGDKITTARYRQRPHIHSTDVRFIDTGVLAKVQSETSYGLEAAAISGPFHAASEAHWLKRAGGGLADPGFFGAYAEVGYFLSRRHDRSDMLRRPSEGQQLRQAQFGLPSPTRYP